MPAFNKVVGPGSTMKNSNNGTYLNGDDIFQNVRPCLTTTQSEGWNHQPEVKITLSEKPMMSHLRPLKAIFSMCILLFAGLYKAAR